jgi:ABC-2 type transport system ATP-binding protein
VIVADGLTKMYGRRAAVDGLDLRVGAGELFGLLGPNGAGKSTTVEMLCGLAPPTSGSAHVAGCNVTADGERFTLRRRIGVLREESAPYSHMTAHEYLEWSGTLHGLPPAEARRRAADLLALLELAHAADQPMGEYSMGMRKKTALAGALLHAPRVLFLDEALNGVDAVSARIICRLLRHLTERRGVTVLFTSHVLETVERLCDRIAIMQAGRIVAQGSVGELRETAGLGADAPLEEVYLQLTASARNVSIPG